MGSVVTHGRRALLGESMALAGAFVASALVPGARAVGQTTRRGGTLVLGATLSPRHLNGAVQSGAATGLVSTQLFASPLRYDDRWQPQPYLAESWLLAPDGKSLTLTLRAGALFHDGRPVTSADVAYSIMAIKANHPFAPMMAPVEWVETPDPRTAVIRMGSPHPAILLAMSPALCPILPKHVYDDGTDLKTHARNSSGVIGSGPFKLAEFTPGQRIVLERFDKFFLPGKPYLDKIVVTIAPEMSTLVLGLERGEIQIMPFISIPTDLKRIAANPQLELLSKGYEGIGAINWLAFNLEKKPLADPAVRKAIAGAIDKQFVTRVLMGGFAKVDDGPIAPGSPFAITDMARYPLDLDQSRRLLDAAGYKPDADGTRLRLTMDYIPNLDDQQKNLAEYTRAQLKKIGIAVEVRASADFAAWAKRIAAHDFDLTMDQVYNWGDPVIGVHRTYLSSNIRPIVWTNTQSYRNPKVDELLQAAGQVLDATQRKAYYAAFQKIIADELPVIFINTVPFHTAASKRLADVPRGIWGPLSPFDEIRFR